MLSVDRILFAIWLTSVAIIPSRIYHVDAGSSSVKTRLQFVNYISRNEIETQYRKLIQSSNYYKRHNKIPQEHRLREDVGDVKISFRLDNRTAK